MSRRQLYQDLAAVRALVADGRSRLRESTGDLDQFGLNSARGRLETIDGFLIAAAGGVGGWVRTAIGAAGLGGGAAVAAVVTEAAGFPTFWVIVCAWVAGLLVEMPVRRRLARLAPELGRRRLDRVAARINSLGARDRSGPPSVEGRPTRDGAASADGPTSADGTVLGDGPGLPWEKLAAPAEELVSLPGRLVDARVRLVSIALREAGSKHWRVPYLARVAAGEPTTYWLAEADTLLCQAIDHLEQYLAADTKEPS